MFVTYILYSKSKDHYYIGSTKDLNRRIKEHNSGQSKSTKYGVPWEIVFIKQFDTKTEAVQFEVFIKKQKSRSFVKNLIQQNSAHE